MQRRQSHSRRAWNDTGSWSKCLHRLEVLEEFALRTAATFVRIPAHLSSEKTTLLKWTAGTKRQATCCSHHPTLSYIRVWYRCQDAGNGVITHWSRFAGTWENILRMCDPHEGTPF